MSAGGQFGKWVAARTRGQTDNPEFWVIELRVAARTHVQTLSNLQGLEGTRSI